MENFGYVGNIRASSSKDRTEKKEETLHTYTYEEAVSLTETGKFHIILILICGLSIMAFIIETLGVGLIIPLARCDLNITLSQEGFLASAAFLGTALSSHIWGFLADTWGRLKVLRVANLSAVIFAAISAFSFSVWMLIVFRFLVGISVAGSMASAFTYLGEFHGIKTRRKAVTNLSVFLTVGIVYTPALAIGILPLEIDAYLFGMQLSSWRLFLLAASIPGILCVISLQFLPKSPRYLLIQGDHDGALDILKMNFIMNTSKTRDQYPVRKINLDTVGQNLSNVHSIKDALLMIWSQTIPIFYRSRIWNTLNFICQMFLMFFVTHGIFMWAPSIVAAGVRNIESNMTICDAIRDSFHMKSNITSATASCSSYADVFTYTAMLIMGIIFTILYILAGLLVTPVGPKRLLILYMVVAGICGICLYWSNNFYLNNILFMGLVAVGILGGVVNSLAVEYYPSNINAMALCFILMAGRIGSVAGSNLIGKLVIQNCETIFTSLGVLILIAAFLSTFLPAKSIKPKLIKTIG